MKENKNIELQQAAFRADFEKRTGQNIAFMELVSLEASPESLKQLGLQYPATQFCLWGLLILCESKSVYFYSHAQDFSIMGFKPTDSEALGTKEQLTCLSEKPEQLKVHLPQHKTRIGRLLAPNNILLAETAAGATCTLKTMKKAALLLERLADYAAMN